MRKNLQQRILALALAAALALTGCAGGQGAASSAAASAPASSAASAPAQAEEEALSPREDFYAYVNAAQLDSWDIPADSTSVSWFTLATDNVTERVTDIVLATAENDATAPGSDEANIRALYLTGMDTEGRDAAGLGEVLTAFFAAVDEAQTVDELLAVCMEYDRTYGVSNLLTLVYDTDYMDSNQKVLYFGMGDSGLSKEVWESDDPSNQAQAEAFTAFLAELAELEGRSPEQAQQTAEQTVAMMRQMAAATLPMEEQYDVEKIYNVYQVADLPALLGGHVTVEQIAQLYGVQPEDTVIISLVDLVEAVAGLLTEENLPALKDYVKLCAHKNFADIMDMDSYAALMTYLRASTGAEEDTPFEEYLMSLLQAVMGFSIGRLYCQQYLTEEDRQNVTDIVHQVTEVYDARLAEADWLSEETRAQARTKLKALDAQVGWPETWPQDRYEVILRTPDEGGVMIDNYMEMTRVARDYKFATSDEPVDKTLWPDNPQTVNAYYNPSTNGIYLLGGILQAPFYDPDASPEENLGGIGMVIAHEITHAFDTSGAQFDEAGNVRNWWTEEDLAHFQAMADEVAAYYSTFEVNGAPVDGVQTVTENIADLGAVACITEIAQKNGYDLDKVYRAYANLWANKSRPEYLAYQLATDVHSPGEVRVNAVLAAQPAFRELYGIVEGDGMYHEAMPAIW